MQHDGHLKSMESVQKKKKNLWSDKIERSINNEKEENDNLYPTYLKMIRYLSISYNIQSKTNNTPI